MVKNIPFWFKTLKCLQDKKIYLKRILTMDHNINTKKPFCILSEMQQEWHVSFSFCVNRKYCKCK